MKIYTISLQIIFFLGMVGLYFIIKCRDTEIEKLQKKLMDANAYKSGYLILRDAYMNKKLHEGCFKVGK